MVHVVVELKVRVPRVALFLPRVGVDILALLDNARLELRSCPQAGTPSIGWSGRVQAGRRTQDEYFHVDVSLAKLISFNFENLGWKNTSNMHAN